MTTALRFFLRLSIPVLVACASAACGGQSSPSGEPTPASTSGGTGSVVGNEGTGTGTGTSTSASTAVPGDSATRFELSNGFCGGAPRSCAGNAGARIVDFGARTFETHRCVELQDDAGADAIPPAPPGTSPLYGTQRGDAITLRTLTPQEITTLRAALDAVRYAPAKLTELDGAMTVLSVDAPSGHFTLTPVARCGAQDYEQIVQGLPELEAALAAL